MINECRSTRSVYVGSRVSLDPFLDFELRSQYFNVAVCAVLLRAVFLRDRFGRAYREKLARRTHRVIVPEIGAPAVRRHMLRRTSSGLSQRACAIWDCCQAQAKSRRQ